MAEFFLRVLRLLGAVPKNQIQIDRAHRVYRLLQGKTVYVRNSLEQQWLEDDYYELRKELPVFRKHQHPALPQGSAMLSLSLTIRDN